jgi:hypothetical protein
VWATVPLAGSNSRLGGALPRGRHILLGLPLPLLPLLLLPPPPPPLLLLLPPPPLLLLLVGSVSALCDCFEGKRRPPTTTTTCPSEAEASDLFLPFFLPCAAPRDLTARPLPAADCRGGGGPR